MFEVRRLCYLSVLMVAVMLMLGCMSKTANRVSPSSPEKVLGSYVDAEGNEYKGANIGKCIWKEPSSRPLNATENKTENIWLQLFRWQYVVAYILTVCFVLYSLRKRK